MLVSVAGVGPAVAAHEMRRSSPADVLDEPLQRIAVVDPGLGVAAAHGAHVEYEEVVAVVGIVRWSLSACCSSSRGMIFKHGCALQAQAGLPTPSMPFFMEKSMLNKYAKKQKTHTNRWLLCALGIV